MSDEDRAALVSAIEYHLWKMDAEPLYAIALISGLSVDDLRNLGGLE